MRSGMTLVEMVMVLVIISIIVPTSTWLIYSTLRDYSRIAEMTEVVQKGIQRTEYFFTKIYTRVKEFSGSRSSDVSVQTYSITGKISVHSDATPVVLDAKISVEDTGEGTAVLWYVKREEDEYWEEPIYLSPPLKDIDVKFSFDENSTLVNYLGPGIVVEVTKEYMGKTAKRKYFIPLVNIGITSR